MNMRKNKKNNTKNNNDDFSSFDFGRQEARIAKHAMLGRKRHHELFRFHVSGGVPQVHS